MSKEIRKRRFLINPTSGSGLFKNRFSSLNEYFSKNLGTFDYVVSKNAKDLFEKTRQALFDGVEQIIAIGGDGTVNIIVNAFFENGKILNPDTSLVVSKMGTGADFIKTIANGRKNFDWRKLVLDHQIEEFDVGKIEFEKSNFKAKYFINDCGIGANAKVVAKKEQGWQFLPNKLSYIFPTLTTLPFYQPTPCEILFDQESLKIDLFALAIAKGSYAGGGMKFGIDVQPNDGFFEATIFKKKSIGKLLTHLPKIYSGKYGNLDFIEKRKVKKISVRSPHAIPVEFDGEVYGETNLQITLFPKAIRVCVPLSTINE